MDADKIRRVVGEGAMMVVRVRFREGEGVLAGIILQIAARRTVGALCVHNRLVDLCRWGRGGGAHTHTRNSVGGHHH